MSYWAYYIPQSATVVSHASCFDGMQRANNIFGWDAEWNCAFQFIYLFLNTRKLRPYFIRQNLLICIFFFLSHLQHLFSFGVLTSWTSNLFLSNPGWVQSQRKRNTFCTGARRLESWRFCLTMTVTRCQKISLIISHVWSASRFRKYHLASLFL